MLKRWDTHPKGFTIVELLIAVAVIGILIAIAVIGYGNISRSSAARAVQSDLINAHESIESDAALAGGLIYPDEAHFLDGIRITPGVHLSAYVSDLPHYSSLSTVQNGVLISEICQDLVAEGYGKGLNSGGGTDTYISGCGNWNNGWMQVTGWSTQQFNAPVSSTTFTDYADSVPPGDAYHPNQRSTIQGFYREMNRRFLAQGGTYPITSFWDSWATPTNGGVERQDLPAADTIATAGVIYCIEGRHDSSNTIWHIRQNGKIAEGNC